MDTNEFRQKGKEMVDFICNYLSTLDSRRVTPSIEPGYLKDLIPVNPPSKGENWEKIMEDVESKIIPGMTHWQHPRFHAYFPAGNSFPSLLGDMLADGLGCIGFSWAASPACTELETIVLDWFGKMIGLPDEFLTFSENSKGGGVIQSSASECVLVNLLAARAQAIRQLKRQNPFVEEGVLLSKLMAYCSKESHSCVEKAAMISFVKLRILEPDDKFSLRGSSLRQAMEEDRAMGLVPFFVSTTLGTTSCCSFDNLAEIGPVCEENDIWLHVDAAYAGSAFICPEFKHLMKGIEYASSFNTNCNKFLLTHFDCSTMWVKDRYKLTQALVVDPLYLQHSYSEKSIDYRHWGIPLSRRFRSLKLWFVIRSYGVEGLQKYIREHVRLAKRFEKHVLSDQRFEVVGDVTLGLVCFRLRGSNAINQKLLSVINASGKLHMVPASLNEKYVIRFCVCAPNSTDEDIDIAWDFITQFAGNVLNLTDLEDRPDSLKVKLLERHLSRVSLGDDDVISSSPVSGFYSPMTRQFSRTFSYLNDSYDSSDLDDNYTGGNDQRSRHHSLSSNTSKKSCNLSKRDSLRRQLSRQLSHTSKTSLDLSDIEGLTPEELGLVQPELHTFGGSFESVWEEEGSPQPPVMPPNPFEVC